MRDWHYWLMILAVAAVGFAIGARKPGLIPFIGK